MRNLNFDFGATAKRNCAMVDVLARWGEKGCAKVVWDAFLL